MTTNTVECPAVPVAASEPLEAWHGVLSWADAVRVLGTDGLRAALDSRTWIELWPGVVVVAHRVLDPLSRGAAALLRAGPHAVLSGATAVALHGCSAAETETLAVTIPYDRQTRSLPGLSVRQAWIRESDVVELDGLRAHTLDVALAELLCTGPQRAALACLEQALSEVRAADAEHFRHLVGERVARRRDRRGTRQATALLHLAWAGSPAPVRSGSGCPRSSAQAGEHRGHRAEMPRAAG